MPCSNSHSTSFKTIQKVICFMQTFAEFLLFPFFSLFQNKFTPKYTIHTTAITQ